MKTYGWYSLDAYKNGEPEYRYLNPDGQETICTAFTEDIHPPETYGFQHKKERSMNIYKDQCYICLDEKTYFKKSKVCVNDGCWMFICKQCFGELTKSDIANCPICHEDLVKESYYLDYLSFMKKARETMIKIVLYVVFYSIGLSTVIFVLIGPNKFIRLVDIIICLSSYWVRNLVLYRHSHPYRVQLD